MSIILLATAWGPLFGGVNAFNRDLAAGLASVLGSTKVFSSAINPTADDFSDAGRCGVTLLPISTSLTTDQFIPDWIDNIQQLLRQSHGSPNISLWIGHDVISGEAALKAASIAGGQAALIMHMSYVDYQGIKHANAPDADKKHKEQKRLFQSGGARLFAIGPLLRDACHDLTGTVPTMLIPGFPDLPTLRHPRNKITAITFGRMERSSDRIKQGRLAVSGFATAVKATSALPVVPPIFQNPRLYVVGLANKDEENELRALAESKSGRLVNILALPFETKRTELYERLAEANLALMLSWHEGFGLTGWEAIAAELPLIVGKHTGVFKLIEETLGGAGTGCLHSIDVEGRTGEDDSPNYTDNDVNSVSEAIQAVGADLEPNFRNAQRLKEQLKNSLRCTWSATAQELLRPSSGDTIARNTTLRENKSMQSPIDLSEEIARLNKELAVTFIVGCASELACRGYTQGKVETFKQLAAELVDNAYIYGCKNDRDVVTLRAHIDAVSASFQVANPRTNPIGISKEEVLERAAAPKTERRGSGGIGLPEVYMRSDLMEFLDDGYGVKFVLFADTPDSACYAVGDVAVFSGNTSGSDQADKLEACLRQSNRMHLIMVLWGPILTGSIINRLIERAVENNRLTFLAVVVRKKEDRLRVERHIGPTDKVRVFEDLNEAIEVAQAGSADEGHRE